jgi:tubulin polyglutamylase TTLL5
LYTEADKASFLQRLTDKGGGMDLPWVLKRATASRGRGVTMLGPQSQELTQLQHELATAPIKKGHIIQSYIQNEWTFQGHKCDLRVYVVVASVDPLIVYYHDGIVRTAAGIHNEQNFTESKAHLTNVSQNKQNRTAWEPVKTFDDLHDELVHYVQSRSLAWDVDAITAGTGTITSTSPVQYIRNQIKDIIATVFAAFQSHISLAKIPPDNAFALMGADFVIDNNLKVWLLEMQLGPQLLGDGHVKKTTVLQDVLLTTIDVVEEVYQKQVNGLPVLPLQNTGQLELVFSTN